MKNSIIAVFAALVALIGMSSCSSVNEEGEATSAPSSKTIIIYTDRLCFPSGDLSVIQDSITALCTDGGKLTFIEADGEPSIVNSVEIPPAPTGYTADTTKSKINDRVETVKSVIKSMKADNEDSDLIGALQLASKESALGDQIIIIDNGLITSSKSSNRHKFYLDFIDVDQTTEKLIKAKEIPDLSGREIVMYGLGQTSTDGNQEKLTELEIEILKEFYTRFFEHSGANYTFVNSQLINIPKEDVSSYPSCNVVPVLNGGDNIVQKEDDSETEEDSSVKEETKKPIVQPITLTALGKTSLPFKADSADIEDEKAAIDSLNDVIIYLQHSPEAKIIIAGSTATYGDAQSCKDFGLKRSEAVKSLITKTHPEISNDQIETKGLGYTSIFHIADLDSSGKLIEEKAEANRVVYIASLDTDDGKLLKSS